MTNLESKIKEYREMKRLAEEAQTAADSIADELKAAMTEAGETKLIVGEYKLSYTDCTRRDIDKKALQADHADIYTAYLKETSYKRFAVA
jgi:predicted phage-related endonuclease